MRIALTADLHIANFRLFGGEMVAGINDRGRLVLQVVRRMAEVAAEKECRELWVLGDIFDTTRPEPQIVTEAVNALSVPHITTELLVGNHDQNSPATGDHALGPLWQAGFNVHEKPTLHQLDVGSAIVVPFWPGDARQWLPEMVREVVRAGSPARTAPRTDHDNRPYILLTHVGIYDNKIPPYMRTQLDAVPIELLSELCKEHGITHVFAGNWHSSRQWRHEFGHVVTQLGTPCPTGFDNPGYEGVGLFWIFDTVTRELAKHALPGPRFYTLPYSDRIAADIQKLPGCPIYVRLKSKLAERQVAERALQGLSLQSDRPYVGEVVPDKDEIDKMVRRAAEAASSASTFEERIAAYVAAVPLETAVDRAALLAQVRKYLGR